MIHTIRTIYAHRLTPCEREAITADTLLDDIHTDCLERAEIALAVEDMTGVQVSDAALMAWVCVGDALQAASTNARSAA